jgi:plastocyanin
MISPAAKLLLVLSGASGVLAVGYGIADGERGGAVLLVAACVAALLAAVAVIGALGPDLVEDPQPDEVPAPVTFGPVDAARPSPWPLVVAVAATTIAVGAAEGPAYVVGGGIVALVAALGWVAQAWREHPSFSPRIRARLSSRVVVPGLLPVLAFLVAAVIAISVSRILLAVSKNGSVAVALTAATVILAACAVVATRPRLSSSALGALAVVGALLAGTAGIVGAAAGERTIHPETSEIPVIVVVAKNTQFTKDHYEVPAGEKVEVDFRNEDAVFHDFAVYREDGTPVFAGRPVVHRDEKLEMKIPESGTYTFVCDFHPNMKGDLVAG